MHVLKQSKPCGPTFVFWEARNEVHKLLTYWHISPINVPVQKRKYQLVNKLCDPNDLKQKFLFRMITDKRDIIHISIIYRRRHWYHRNFDAAVRWRHKWTVHYWCTCEVEDGISQGELMKLFTSLDMTGWREKNKKHDFYVISDHSYYLNIIINS